MSINFIYINYEMKKNDKIYFDSFIIDLENKHIFNLPSWKSWLNMKYVQEGGLFGSRSGASDARIS